MDKMEKVIKEFEFCLMPPSREEIENDVCSHEDCPYYREYNGGKCISAAVKDALALLKANKDEIMALRRLVEWAEECGFGLDNIYWKEYVKPEELEGMAYIQQLIYIAKKAVKKDE